MPSNILLIGFPKCGQMSYEVKLKRENPDVIVCRSESIYNPDDPVPEGEWDCYCITRNPLDRIKSGRQYFKQLRDIPIEDMINGNFTESFHQLNLLGFGDCIDQSNYPKYIELYEERNNLKVKVVKFEDMIKDPSFPYVNETENKIKWTKAEEDYVNGLLIDTGISY